MGLASCEPLFADLGSPFYKFCRCTLTVQPLQPISRPCSKEKYPSSRMANGYTGIFDAGSNLIKATKTQFSSVLFTIFVAAEEAAAAADLRLH